MTYEDVLGCHECDEYGYSCAGGRDGLNFCPFNPDKQPNYGGDKDE